MPRFSDEAAARVLGEIHQREVVELLQRLIQVPSVNPPGDVRLAVEQPVPTLRLSEAGISELLPPSLLDNAIHRVRDL